ncbi:MAG TPA: hypoxanthine phosphoribosyltransferase [Candidatus Avacidaminococcus intestinavium]|uniref:Hypoxanthine phosphoribosyltransferase n=1 Tax=Candidatus Avacidaminococcus intestinavium TaxID=2840684 RepID=A0A9D1MNY7_9FIRM|nr:hypoxanthine phosphoribosyltransferase [Candidatus Avacidaminococcus intestinavium]
MHKDIKEVLFSEEVIAAKVQEMGAQITADYAGQKLIVVSLLKGAVYFTADLTKKIDLPVRLDFMIASSYGDESISAGNINVIKDIDEKIAGKHVLLIDDIIDTGLTLDKISKLLETHHPLSVKTAVLLDKGARRVNNMNADYVGFEIPDEFVVGYGLDFAGDYRNLPFIGILKPAVFAKK